MLSIYKRLIMEINWRCSCSYVKISSSNDRRGLSMTKVGVKLACPILASQCLIALTEDSPIISHAEILYGIKTFHV